MSASMRNLKTTYLTVILLISCLILIACTTIGETETAANFQVGPSYKPTRVETSDPIDFKMAPPLGRIDMTHVYSRSITRTRSNNQLLHEREEIVNFSVKTEVKAIDAKTGDRTIVVETLRKDGPVDLYDLGYPEAGESLEYVYTTKALVKKAGHFPSNTLFFIPPVSLPKKPASVGETWAMQAQWVALRNGLPMTVDVVSIFKGLYKCGTKGQCAEFEISGDVTVPDGLTKTAKLTSTLSGRVLYSLTSGAVLWSDIRNVEKLMSADDQMEIYSCTETLLEEPENERWPWRAQVGCDPMGPAPIAVPGVQ